MNKHERNEIKSDIGVIKSLMTDGLASLDHNQGTRVHLQAAYEALDDLLDRIDGWVSPHKKLDSLHTDRRLRIAYNKLRYLQMVPAQRDHCSYAGYHITGVSVIQIGNAEGIIRDLITDRKERKHGDDLGT